MQGLRDTRLVKTETLSSNYAGFGHCPSDTEGIEPHIVHIAHSRCSCISSQSKPTWGNEVEISSPAVRRRFVEYGLASYRPAQGAMLTAHRKERLLQFAWEHVNSDGRQMIFWRHGEAFCAMQFCNQHLVWRWFSYGMGWYFLSYNKRVSFQRAMQSDILYMMLCYVVTSTLCTTCQWKITRCAHIADIVPTYSMLIRSPTNFCFLCIRT